MYLRPLYGKTVCKKCYYSFANRRQIAYLIDVTLWQAISFGAGIPFGMVVFTLFPGITQDQLGWAGFAFGYVLFLVFACKDGFNGHSLGRFIAGVQVVDESSSRPIGFGASFKRNICLAIPFVVLVILVQMNKGHRLGDRWAGSRVIWKKYRNHPVFTGAPVEEPGETFLPGGGQGAGEDDNPFASPRT